MAKERNSAKFIGWLGGIAATVLSGYLLWYFEQPKPAPPPPLPAAVTTFEGMVYSGDAPVSRALVGVALTGSAGSNGAIHDVTDDNGAYKIELTGLPQGTGATLSVAAKGFEAASPKILPGPLQTDVRVDIPLNPAVASVTAPPPPVAANPGVSAAPPTTGGSGKSGSLAMRHIPVYVPKSAAMAMKFRVAAKKQP
jgi:hypothetical protein